MGYKDRFDSIKKEFSMVLEKNLGIVSTTCKQLGVSRSWYYEMLKSDPEFKQECDDVNELVIDIVETQLHKNIKDGKEASALFYLKTRGKHRGYIERNEFTGANGGPIQTQVLDEDRQQAFNRMLSNLSEQAVADYKTSLEGVNGNNCMV